MYKKDFHSNLSKLTILSLNSLLLFIAGSELAMLQERIDEWEDISGGCVKYVPRSGESDYVQFQNANSGCYSSVGRVGGRQTINLADGCFPK